MPFKIKKRGNGYFVYNTKTGKSKNKQPHKTKKEANKHLAALQINISQNESYDQLCNKLLGQYLFETNTSTLSSGANPSTLDLDNNDEHKAAAAEMLKNDPELKSELGHYAQTKTVINKDEWKKILPAQQQKIIDLAKKKLQQGQKNNAVANNSPALPLTNTVPTGGTTNVA
jgi:hypothetical protein